MGFGRIFFQGEPKAFFQEGATVIKFIFQLKTNIKICSTKKLIGKYQISKSRGSRHSPPRL